MATTPGQQTLDDAERLMKEALDIEAKISTAASEEEKQGWIVDAKGKYKDVEAALKSAEEKKELSVDSEKGKTRQRGNLRLFQSKLRTIARTLADSSERLAALEKNQRVED